MHICHNSFESALTDVKDRLKQNKHTVLSLDIFDTLILRRCTPHGTLDAVGNWFDNAVKKIGSKAQNPDALAAFHAAYEKCADLCAEKGLDREAKTEDLYSAWVSEYLGKQNKLESMACELPDKMLEYELLVTEPNPCMIDFLRSLKGEKIKLIYISDMYLPKFAIDRILAKHNLLHYFSSGYVSADFGLNKRSGNLFNKVLEVEKLDPQQVIHLGDNEHSDGMMAARTGMTGISVRDKRLQKRAMKIHWAYEFHKANKETQHFVNCFTDTIPGSLTTLPEQYAHNIWAPIYTSFVHNVIEKSISDGVEHLYFLARDGYLFYKIYKILVEQYPQKLGNQTCKPPRATYLGVSRISTMFFPSKAFGIREVSLSTLTEAPTIIDAFSTLGFKPAELTSIANDYSIANINTPLPTDHMHWPPLLAMILDDRIQARFKKKKASYSDLLPEYLEQEGFMHYNKIGLVDCGWRGQIQESISLSLKKLCSKNPPTIIGYYMGTQIEAPQRTTARNRYVPLIADIVNFEWMGGSILHCITLIEALCTPNHGTVIGYRNEKGIIKPVLKKECKQVITSFKKAPIRLMQESIFEYAKKYATVLHAFGICNNGSLKQAKYLCCRAIRFPTQREADLLLGTVNVSDQGTENTTRLICPIESEAANIKALRISVQRSLWKAAPIALYIRFKTPYLFYLALRSLKSLPTEIYNNKLPECSDTLILASNENIPFETPQYSLLTEVSSNTVETDRSGHPPYKQLKKSYKPYHTAYENRLILFCQKVLIAHSWFSSKQVTRYSSPQPLIAYISKVRIRKGMTKLKQLLKLKPNEGR